MAGKKISNRLVTLSSAAILAVYSAGFVRTRPAAARFSSRGEHRRGAPGSPAAVVIVKEAAPTAGLRPDAVGERVPGPARAGVSPAAPAAGVAAGLPAIPAPSASPSVSAPAAPNSPVVAAAVPPPATVPAPVNVPVPVAAAPLPANAPAAISTASNVPKASPPPVASAPAPAAAYTSTPAGVASSSDNESADDAVAPTPAPAPQAPAPVTQAAPSVRYADGTYYGWGYSRHGDIQAYVVIQNSRIAGVGIAQCETRYPCDLLQTLPYQVLARQSAEVDNVSGASESTDAFYGAVVEALSKAK